MTHHPAAPSHADAPHPWVRTILHARMPAALKLLLLALLAALAMGEAPRRTLRALRQDWLFSNNPDLAEDLDAAQDPCILRMLCRLRAELGWLMRGAPNRGITLAAPPAPEPCPAQSARAPP